MEVQESGVGRAIGARSVAPYERVFSGFGTSGDLQFRSIRNHAPWRLSFHCLAPVSLQIQPIAFSRAWA